MHPLAILGGVIALGSHLFWIWDILKDRIHMNLATWVVWASMDITTLLVSIAAGAPAPFLVTGYAIGASLVVIALLTKGSWQWGFLETACTLISLSCLVLWYFEGPVVALILLVTGKYIGGIPSLKQAYRSPEPRQSPIWFLGMLGASTNIIVENSWTIAQSLLPTIALIFAGLMGIVNLHHLQKSKTV